MGLFNTLKNLFRKPEKETPKKEGLLSRSFDRPAKSYSRQYEAEHWLKVLRDRDISGKKISVKNFKKQTQIKEAIEEGDMKLLSELIDWEKVTPKEMDYLIQAGCLGVNTYIDEYHRFGPHQRFGYTPLSLAAQHENIPLVKYLLEHGANPNATLSFSSESFSESFPVFFYAFSNPKIVDLFLEHGANPYAHTYYTGKRNNYEQGMSDKHPIVAAIRTNNLAALKKMTSTSYHMPEWFLKNISTISNVVLEERGKSAPTPAELYWEAFVDQALRKERKELRKKLARAQKEGDTEQKKEIIKKLAGEFDRYSLRRKGEDPLRYAQAEEYRTIKRKYGSKMALSARKTLEAKRKKALG